MKVKGSVAAILVVLSLFVGAGGMFLGLTLWNGQDPDGISSGDQASNPVEEKGFQKIRQAYEYISNSYVEDVQETEVIEGAIQGMIGTLDDPYSVYMDKETVKQFTESLDSSFEGIGAEVSMVDGKVTIVAPFKDSPAEKAGLKPNDKIVTIDGKSIEGLDLYSAVLKIRGKKGTTVTLGIERPGVPDIIEIDVTRDEIPIETVFTDIYERNGKKIGLIEITSFSENTAYDFRQKLGDLERADIDGLLVDVRGNPGGYLESVQEIAQEIIPDRKPFVQIENRNGEKQRFVSSLQEKKPYPIVGLIDGGSASASEILAGALKEVGGYELVGEKTFGKGTVQQTVDLGDGSNLKLTMFKWLTPDGNWIHEKGIEPTVKVTQPAYFYVSPLSVDREPLKYDMNNSQVKNAQIMLQGLGYAPGRTDGYFSKETKQSVKAFQEKHDLEKTGEIDRATASRLQEEIVEEMSDPDNDAQLQTAIELLAG